MTLNYHTQFLQPNKVVEILPLHFCERSNRSMDNMSRRSGARRDSMGRYTRDDAREDFIYEVEELMNKAPDEHTRMKFERMLNDMR